MWKRGKDISAVGYLRGDGARKCPGECSAGKKNTNKLKNTSAKNPGQGRINRGDYAVYAVANPAVTAPDPAGKDAEQPVASEVPGYTSMLHHVKGF